MLNSSIYHSVEAVACRKLAGGFYIDVFWLKFAHTMHSLQVRCCVFVPGFDSTLPILIGDVFLSTVTYKFFILCEAHANKWHCRRLLKVYVNDI